MCWEGGKQATPWGSRPSQPSLLTEFQICERNDTQGDPLVSRCTFVCMSTQQTYIHRRTYTSNQICELRETYIGVAVENAKSHNSKCEKGPGSTRFLTCIRVYLAECKSVQNFGNQFNTVLQSSNLTAHKPAIPFLGECIVKHVNLLANV